MIGGPATLAVNPNLYPDVGYTLEDFAPIAYVAELQFVLVAGKAMGVASVADLVALSKEKPGTLNFGSAGIGNTAHHAGELFKARTGADLTHIPYAGGALALKGLLAGETHMQFGTVTETMPYITSGDVVPVASLGASRVESLPDVPTLSEQGVQNAEISAWYGFYAPRGTPADVIAKLNGGFNEILRTDQAKEVLGKLGLVLGGGSAAKLDARLRGELPRWIEMITLAGGPIK